MPIAVAGLFLAVVSAMAVRGDLPLAVPALYLAASITAFVLYGIDKSAAAGGRWRTPEDTLLVVGLVGGWPGALVAQELLRHKTRKASFTLTFWTTVVVNCAVLAWFWFRRISADG